MRKHGLPARSGVWVVSLLLVWLTASACQRADVPIAPQPDMADLDPLLRLMEQRLVLMHDVARWKWNERKPITDPERERELLQSVVERGRAKGLDPGFVRAFFEAQMEAARLVQQADFDRWKGQDQAQFAETTSLTVLRQRIDRLNGEMIEVLVEVSPGLSSPFVQQALPRQAEEVLTGDGLAAVRDTAIAPLRR
jgi:chorismate mutase